VLVLVLLLALVLSFQMPGRPIALRRLIAGCAAMVRQ
jgi:hypothetical protein